MTATPQKKLLRGRVLSFTAEPLDHRDTDAYRYIEDGALLIEGGRIAAMGAYEDVAPQAAGVPVADHRRSPLHRH